MAAERVSSLRLVSDEYGRATTLGGLRIVAAPAEMPPFRVDALAVEEDTYLLLSAAPEVREPAAGFEEAAAAMSAVEPAQPGTVLVGRGEPTRLLAVVHDVDRDPTWREEWVESAVESILRIAAGRRYRAIGLPALGSQHGALRPRRFALILKHALRRHTPPHLARLWLVIDAAQGAGVIDALREAAQ